MREGMVRARDGCQLFVSIAGEGEKLLLIPGLGGSAKFWTAIVPILRQKFTIVLMDHRGAGRSERPEQIYSVESLARDACDVLDHFEINVAHVAGHSTGGAIAQAMAIDHPGRVRRMVLSGSWAKADAPFRLLFETRLTILEQAGPQASAAMSFFLGCPPEWIRDHIADVKAGIENANSDLEPLAVAAARIRMVLNFDRLADLHRIAAPVLVIAAPDDAIVAFHLSQQLAQAIPGSRFMSMPGGHFFPRVHPQAYADMMADFIAAKT